MLYSTVLFRIRESAEQTKGYATKQYIDLRTDYDMICSYDMIFPIVPFNKRRILTKNQNYATNVIRIQYCTTRYLWRDADNEVIIIICIL